MKTNSPIIIGLDIGTTKVVAIAAVKNEQGKIEVIGFGRANSHGVEHGLVRNIEHCVKSIEDAITDLRTNNPHLEVNNVYVGIAGKHVKSLQNRGERIRTDIDSLISRVEIDLLIQDQRMTYLPPGDRIIDIVPQDFTVDDERNILDPIGRRGTKLGANFHIITGGEEDIKSINMCVNKANLQTAEIVLQPMASAAAVMSEEELEVGVAIVDIGGGTTDMAIFKEGILHHTAVIPFAGEDITEDIKKSLGILKTQAELMKTKHGSALPIEKHKNSYITIAGIKGRGHKEIAFNNLARIIECRVQEIMALVLKEIQRAGLEGKLNGGIILTGGGAHLKYVDQLSSFVTKMDVRLGIPDEHLALDNSKEYAILQNPMYSTCIGLVLKGFSDIEQGRTPFHRDLSENKVFDINENQTMKAHDLFPKDHYTNDDVPFEDQLPESDDQETHAQQTTEASKDKIDARNRMSKINNVFKSLKTRVLNTLDGEDDVDFQDN